jgi:iron complex outermembrane receptor protein
MRVSRLVLGSIIAIGPMSLTPLVQAEESTGAIEEITVTSRRLEESVQDVPLSVTVFGEEAINKLKPTTLRDFDGLAPNVYIGMNAAGPGNSAIYIRGVGYPGSEKTQSPQVGVIVDDVQLGSNTGQLIDVFDIESIEINRGPQGVLYGRNTIGGNIVVNRVKPKFNDLGFDVSAGTGNYSSRTLKARINIPLIDDTLALKIGLIDRDRDGYYDQETLGGSAGDIDFASQTVALRWAATENFEAFLTYDRIDDTSQILPQDARFDGDDRFETIADKREPTDYQVDQLSLRLNWDITDKLSLFSVTANNSGSDDTTSDFDGAHINSANNPLVQLHTQRDQDFDYFSQELRLHGSITDSLDFMLGFYYFDSELDFSQLTNNVVQVPFGLPTGVPCTAALPFLRDNPALGNSFCQFPNARSTQIATEEVESTAFFASITWRPTEELEFSFGARRIDEEKDATNSFFDHSDFTFDDADAEDFDFTGRPTVPGSSYATGDEWDDTIITASAGWAFRENARVYASYSEGFRSGGFSIRAVSASDAAYEPEEADQVEIGFKSELFDGALHFNVAYYKLKRDNGQFISIITLPPGAIPGTNTIINNGGESETDGWEVETLWAINENFSLIANAGTMNSDTSAFTLPCEVIDGCVTGTPGVFDPPGTLRELGGNSDSRQPDSSWALSLAYSGQVGPGTLSANTGYKRVGDFLLVNTGGGADQRLFEGGYGQWDARIAYDWQLSGGDFLSLSLFGKNLSDEEFKEQALYLGGPDTGFQGWGAPRTYALELRYSR